MDLQPSGSTDDLAESRPAISSPHLHSAFTFRVYLNRDHLAVRSTLDARRRSHGELRSTEIGFERRRVSHEMFCCRRVTLRAEIKPRSAGLHFSSRFVAGDMDQGSRKVRSIETGKLLLFVRGWTCFQNARICSSDDFGQRIVRLLLKLCILQSDRLCFQGNGACMFMLPYFALGKSRI